MSFSNVTRSIDLSASDIYLNYPAIRGIDAGYWLIYSASSADNSTLGASVKAYKWGEELPVSTADGFLTIDGTVQLISESLDLTSPSKLYHGSSLVHIGPGINDVTDELEDDALFFGHLGEYAAGPDDFFYWDRLYLGQGESYWDYYKYHAHNPSSYVQYGNGRITFAAQNRIGSNGDERYGYMIPIDISYKGSSYQHVLARVHQPSIGGAHNSHNDVELPATKNTNYMPGGIVNGTGDKFHAFYTKRESANNWRLYSRTYLYTNSSFNAEVDHGVFSLADSSFDPDGTPPSMSLYNIRASQGDLVDGVVCFPSVFYNTTSSLYDLRSIDIPSANNLVTDDITIKNILTGSSVMPDAHLAQANGELYAAVSQPSDGGVGLYKFSGSAWVGLGDIVSNNPGSYLRVHGFDFNAAEFKFYTLISGDISGSGTYSGSGLYSFDIAVPFSGYQHLDYVTGSNSFIIHDALTDGYVTYDTSTNSLLRASGSEPQGIDNNNFVVNYNTNSDVFYGKDQYSFEADEFFNVAIELQDGRTLFAGQRVTNSPPAEFATSDVVFALRSPADGATDFYTITGSKDDEITSAFQSTVSSSQVFISGFTKNELVPRKNLILHGIGRAIKDFPNKLEWVDMYVSSSNEQFYVGNHIDGPTIIMAKYDDNYNLAWQRELSAGVGSDVAYAISKGENGSFYIAGKTNNTGSGDSDGLVIKVDNGGSVVWAKTYGTEGQIVSGAFWASVSQSAVSSGSYVIPGYEVSGSQFDQEYISDIDLVTSGSDTYLIASLRQPGPVSGSNTTFLVLDEDGDILTQSEYYNLGVNAVRNHETTTDGSFVFAGEQYYNTEVTYTVTNNGTSNYIFNGGGYVNNINPTLTLYRGAVYRFVMSGPSANHPFAINTVNTIGTGSLYTGSNNRSDVVFGQGARYNYPDTADTLIFMPSEDTPDLLHYNCTNHTNMNAPINIVDNPRKGVFGKGNVNIGNTMHQFTDAIQSSSNDIVIKDIKNTGTDEYIMVGGLYSSSFVAKATQNSLPWVTFIESSSLNALTSTISSVDSASRYTYVAGFSSASTFQSANTDTGIMAQLDQTGSMLWINTLGHTKTDYLNAIELDYIGQLGQPLHNLITAGASFSHAATGSRTFAFRFENSGNGTGNYHLENFPQSAIYYETASLDIFVQRKDETQNLYGIATITVDTGSVTSSAVTTFTYGASSYTEEIYDGGLIYDAFFGRLNLDKLQSFKNSSTFIENGLNPLNDQDAITFYQIGQAGDGTADDGNIFAYDVIELQTGSNAGEVVIAAQTSGDTVKKNLGTSGVYDYLIGFWNPSTNVFRKFQNGGEFDEEIYSVTELADGNIAFVGRTAGTLGGTNSGGYDIFVGIMNSATGEADYYQTGSGQSDRALGVHDVGNDTIAIVYETAGALGNNENNGGRDVGIIYFDYVTDTWGEAYQIGTTSDEFFDQRNNVSVYLPDGRIAVALSTAGNFADNQTTFGGVDIGLAVFDTNDNTWTKYTVGSTSADFGNAITTTQGQRLIVAGGSGASFTDPRDFVIAYFDITKGFKGRTTY